MFPVTLDVDTELAIRNHPRDADERELRTAISIHALLIETHADDGVGFKHRQSIRRFLLSHRIKPNNVKSAVNPFLFS